MLRSLRSATAFLLVLVATGLVSASSPAKHDAQWHEFKRRFHRKYATKHEEATRRAYFEHNLAAAAAAQSANPLATFGINHFSDRSQTELRQMRGLPHDFEAAIAAARARQPIGTGVVAQKKKAAAVQSIDWRTLGAVTSVKNQGQCQSCWAFSTTGNIEGQWFLAGHSLVSLSEQELVSCDQPQNGCGGGGLPVNAMEWLLNTTGGWITSEADYPYSAGSGTNPPCALSASTPKVAQITGVDVLPAGEEQNMAAWVGLNGPLSVTVDCDSWAFYTGGILTNCTSVALDHAVLAVGFDLSYSTPYWIVKNSWGAEWGEAGYIRLGFGTNQCMIANAPSSAKVAPKNGNGDKKNKVKKVVHSLRRRV